MILSHIVGGVQRMWEMVNWVLNQAFHLRTEQKGLINVSWTWWKRFSHAKPIAFKGENVFLPEDWRQKIKAVELCVGYRESVFCQKNVSESLTNLLEQKYRPGTGKLLLLVALLISLLGGTLNPTSKDLAVLDTVILLFNSVAHSEICVNMIDHISESQNPHYYHWLIWKHQPYRICISNEYLGYHVVSLGQNDQKLEIFFTQFLYPCDGFFWHFHVRFGDIFLTRRQDHVFKDSTQKWQLAIYC